MEVTSTNFADQYQIDGHLIVYTDFREIAQGGPEVATVSIDGKIVGVNDYFGGPPAFYQGHMFVPRLRRSLIGRYFKICVINLRDRSTKDIGGKEELALISKVDDTSVYFFTDNPNSKLKSVRWN